MPTLKHPRWPDITRDVPEEDVDRWVASGWLDERPAITILPVDPPKPGQRYAKGGRTKNPSLGDD